MPSRRETIAMTPSELSAYLAEQRRIILVTIGPQGMPHPMPISDQVRAALAKRVALRFTPQRVVSWDHGKLSGVY